MSRGKKFDESVPTPPNANVGDEVKEVEKEPKETKKAEPKKAKEEEADKAPDSRETKVTK